MHNRATLCVPPYVIEAVGYFIYFVMTGSLWDVFTFYVYILFFFQVSVDSLSWEFHVSTLDDSNITDPPKVQFSLLYKLHTHTHTQ